MKWNCYKRIEYKTTRIKKGFLFFPRVANCLNRWLEYAEWEEEYTIVKKGFFPFFEDGWETTKWLDIKTN